MIKDIEAKTILNAVKQPETWFGLKYNMNLYRGCQHRCIYCDSRSLCYQIEAFDKDILVKANAIERLADELPRKRIRGTVGTGSMNDPYMPVERHFKLTGQAMELFVKHQFPVHVITKSDLVIRDIDTLDEINKVFATVSFTITTTDDALAKKVEPHAPPPSARYRAMKKLAERGITTGVSMMPILPFIQDNPENIRKIVWQARDAGATYIIPALGMTKRDRQQAYYYAKLDQHFPGLSERYRRDFKNDYYAPAQNQKKLNEVFYEECERAGIATKIPIYEPRPVKESLAQIKMF